MLPQNHKWTFRSEDNENGRRTYFIPKEEFQVNPGVEPSEHSQVPDNVFGFEKQFLSFGHGLWNKPEFVIVYRFVLVGNKTNNSSTFGHFELYPLEGDLSQRYKTW